ncbi:hypothetical protein [Streptomyces sp. 8L]|uniref:hypothetical protein n=1 Tax=Streptomyces sp. 8L TaxID=2877242 RepID=UPI001CD8038B|nr:hypothetical protein [Streptomyces sp. 8L]MCA1220211.1 hypothetical protein [Streptomyces sp. 8L]
MSDVGPGTVRVQITPDGDCFIDKEFFTLPPGVELSEAVLARLRLETAASETPVRAVIQDEQAQYTTEIEINIDGTSHILVGSDPMPAEHLRMREAPSVTNLPPVRHIAVGAISPDRPYTSLPDPYSDRLAVICATASRNRFAEASREADQLLEELSVRFGPNHIYALAVGLVRADIAWLTGDFQYSFRSWVFIAREWYLHLGPQHSMTVHATGNALGCWLRLHSSEAAESASTLRRLLRDVEFPDSGEAARIIDQQMSRYSIAK